MERDQGSDLRNTHRRRARRLAAGWVIGGAFLGLLIVLQTLTLGALLRQAEVNAETGKRIVDCTTPGGECYQDGQRRTAEAVVGINQGTLRVVTAALSCQADGITRQQPLARCTITRAKSADDGN